MKLAAGWFGGFSGMMMLFGVAIAETGVAHADTVIAAPLAAVNSAGTIAEGRFAGGGAYLSFSSNTDVGQVTIGSSKILQLTVTNSGTASETISSITNSNSSFTMTHNCLTTGSVAPLAPGASCVINLLFKPQAVGSQTTDIGVSGDSSRLYYVVHVKGSGVAPGPSLGLSPASVDFGSVAVNSQSASQTVVVKNNGSAAIHITKPVGISGDFDGSTNCTSGGTGTLNPGATCNLSVSFKPTTAGARTGSLTLTSDDAYSPTYTVSLTGTGTAASTQSCTSTALSGDASVSGTGNFTKISVNIVPPCADQGKNGSVFIAASVPQAGIFFLDSNRTWKPFTGKCETAPAYSSGTLGALSQLPVTDGTFSLAGFQGTAFYVGYGVGGASGTACNAMIAGSTYKLVHTIPASATTPTASTIDSRLVGTWSLYHITADYACYYYCNYVTQTVQFSTVTIQSDGKLTSYAGSADKWGGIGGLGGSKYYLYYDASQSHPLQMRKIGGNDWDNVDGVKK